jgi:acyl-CoA reductase-like NAD-dependent aldehyde dehydrogenase
MISAQFLKVCDPCGRTYLYPLVFPAASWAALGICYNSGQDCTAGSRVYVQEPIYDKFLKLLVSKVKAQIIGDGFDEKSGGGPVVRLILTSVCSQ